jgi:spore coat polysaccharide biosynthesis predicted glycosyltransferase SpsG
VNLVDTLDDLETTEQYAQVIVSVMNQEKETPEGFYGGPAYAILREQFRGRVKEVREKPRLVLLSFGGSDPQGLTLKAARALQRLSADIEVLAVAGRPSPSAAVRDAGRRAARRSSSSTRPAATSRS